MVQKILIFNFFFLLFLLSNIVDAKNIIGKAKIIDGDTIHINKKKIRLHGIDAPEINQQCILKTKKWDCGKQSTLELKNLIKNQFVECIITEKDQYKRDIGICYVNKINLNKKMVKKGWAIAYRYYSMDYVIEERYARKKKLGIWNGKFEEPYLYRKRNK